MISTGQILAAAAITALAVLLVCASLRWRLRVGGAAAILAFVGIAAWRFAANALAVNDDFVPLVSVGDTGCLVAGLVGPALVAAAVRVPTRSRWLPALVGGVVGFVVNVVIL